MYYCANNLHYICTMKEYLQFDEVHISPQYQIGEHTQPTWELAYVTCGSGIRTIGGISEAFTDGDLVLVPPQISHCWKFDEEHTDSNGEISNLALFIAPEFLERMSAFKEFKDAVERFVNRNYATVISGAAELKVAELLRKMCEETAEERVLSVMRIICILSRYESHPMAYLQSSVEDAVLSRIRIFLECNLSRHITLSEVCAHAGMSRSGLCTFLRNNKGQTLTEWINNLRIDKARELLISSPASISQIAYSVGFSDIAYFSRTFRKHTGISPSHFRAVKN